MGVGARWEEWGEERERERRRGNVMRRERGRGGRWIESTEPYVKCAMTIRLHA